MSRTTSEVAVESATVEFATQGGLVRAVEGISLRFGEGEFAALLGPSGCGKSTLLRVVAGLQSLSTGRVVVPEGARKAFVFQDANLLPWRNVLRNVALPLELAGVGKSERLARAEKVLHEVGLGDALRRYPAQLSGGMKMRVSLARAVVTEPSLLLLDEPFAALDEITRHRLDEMLLELWQQHRFTALFVTHSIPEAVFLGQRAVVFTQRPARVLLDRRITLDYPRGAEVRTSEAFAQQQRELYGALHGGGL